MGCLVRELVGGLAVTAVSETAVGEMGGEFGVAAGESGSFFRGLAEVAARRGLGAGTLGPGGHAAIADREADQRAFGASIDQIKAWAARAVTAETLDRVFG